MAEPGYHILDVIVDGSSVYSKLSFTGEETKYTFPVVTADHEINVTYGYIIKATAEDHGNISPIGSSKFAPGEKPTFTISPDPGYCIVDIIIDGISFFNCLNFTDEIATYTFTALRSDHTIHAVFGHVITATLECPKSDALLQNFPNPFNPGTWIPYRLGKDSEVIIRIFASTGEMVRELDLGHKDAGIYTSQSEAAYWDGKNETGEEVTSGLYFCSIITSDFSATRKIIVRK